MKNRIEIREDCTSEAAKKLIRQVEESGLSSNEPIVIDLAGRYACCRELAEWAVQKSAENRQPLVVCNGTEQFTDLLSSVPQPDGFRIVQMVVEMAGTETAAEPGSALSDSLAKLSEPSGRMLCLDLQLLFNQQRDLVVLEAFVRSLFEIAEAEGLESPAALQGSPIGSWKTGVAPLIGLRRSDSEERLFLFGSWGMRGDSSNRGKFATAVVQKMRDKLPQWDVRTDIKVDPAVLTRVKPISGWVIRNPEWSVDFTLWG